MAYKSTKKIQRNFFKNLSSNRRKKMRWKCSRAFKISCQPEPHEVDSFWNNLSSVQPLSPVQLFVTPWTAAYQASMYIINSWSLLKLMSVEMVMPSNHHILCHLLLLLPSTFPSIRVFSNESAFCIRWPKFQLQHQSFQWIIRNDFL